MYRRHLQDGPLSPHIIVHKHIGSSLRRLKRGLFISSAINEEVAEGVLAHEIARHCHKFCGGLDGVVLASRFGQAIAKVLIGAISGTSFFSSRLDSQITASLDHLPVNDKRLTRTDAVQDAASQVLMAGLSLVDRQLSTIHVQDDVLAEFVAQSLAHFKRFLSCIHDLDALVFDSLVVVN